MVSVLFGQNVVPWQHQKSLLIFFVLLVFCSIMAWGKAAHAAVNITQPTTENANMSVGWYALNNSDGTAPQYAWKQSAGPTVTLGGVNTNVVTFQPPKVTVDTPLTFELTVTNNNEITSKRTVTVTVKTINVLPIANAGAAQSVNENTAVTLDGSASKDSDGTITQYAWKQTAGPTVTLMGATTAKPTFTAPNVAADTSLTFELTVTDNNGATAKSTVVITVKNVNASPTANAGPAQSVNENTAVTLDGSASKDSDGTITQYAWKQIAGPTVTLTGATTAKPTFTAPTITVDTALTFELTVTDNSKATAKSSVIITVKNINVAPVANAGAAQSVNENTKVTLDGSASKDSDGTITQYAWKQTAGPTVTLTGATTAKPTFTAPNVAADTSLTFELTVTDNNGATAKSTVVITVKNVNASPTANAGPAQSVNENTAVTLDGSASKDSDGTITQYAWKQIAGPTVTLTGATTVKPTFTAPNVAADTSLTFELTVTDNNGATAKSTVVITVKNVNIPPEPKNTTFCSKAVKSVLFKETFDDSVIDSTKWNVDETGGSVLLKDGKISVSGVDSSRFPVIQTINNPFPTSGNFSFYCKAKYNQIGKNGTGACVAVQKMIENGSSAFTYDWGNALVMWADNQDIMWFVANSSQMLFKGTNPSDSISHEYETCVIGSQIIGYRDGIKVGEATLPANWQFPTKIWLGNPVLGSAGYLWSTFDTDTIEVRQLEDGLYPTGWIQNPSTSHYYKVLNNCGNWEQCETAAQAEGAHLVVIKNQAENDWITSTFNLTSSLTGYWIGYTDKNQEGLWKTVTGDIPIYTHWSPGQPDNYCNSKDEDYAHLISSNQLYTSLGYWNDLPIDKCSEAGTYWEITQAIIERTTVPTDTNNNDSFNTGSFTVQANDEIGKIFTIPAGRTQCTFNATGIWDECCTVSDANGTGYFHNSSALPSSPIGALIMRRANGTYEFAGTSATKSLMAGENVNFLFNDIAYGDNHGSQLVSWSCH